MRRLAAAPALVDSLGTSGRRFAETFTWDRAASQTEEHLTECVRARRAGGVGG
jgi:hypothetical protein